MKKAQPGTVIHGSMRTEDLIHIFMATLKVHRHPSWLKFYNENIKTIKAIQENDFIPQELDMEANDFLMEDLFPAMDELSPKNHFFGSHPGNGSDYGYWPLDD